MYAKHIVRNRTWENMSNEVARTRNMLGIRKVDRIYDKNHNQLILLVSTREMLDGDVQAQFQGNLLVLEAPIHFEYSQSFLKRTVNGKKVPEADLEIQLNGIAEIKLKPGYHYDLLSCQAVNPRTVKIVLRSNYIINNKEH